MEPLVIVFVGSLVVCAATLLYSLLRAEKWNYSSF